jgi:Reverse transcriptase (RNA-dependent DNA polymerase)
MALKDDLLRKGYLPENLPPAFLSENIADFFAENPPAGFISPSKRAVRAAVYNASKRGMTRRTFSFIHPTISHDLAEFIALRWDLLTAFFGQTTYSLSVPNHMPDGDRALSISSHGELEAVRLTRLSQYRFIANTDISRFYHAIYTHSIPWAFHGRAIAKRDRDPASKTVFFNRLDHILRRGQDGQTVGIPVGPDASRVIAEVISAAIDAEFNQRKDVDCVVLRHVDDVWIGANSHAEAERALWRYREAIREYELDINENKTRIYGDNFRFSDGWPTEVASQLEYAIDSPAHRVSERLRAALEHAFALTASGGDDGVLKYAIRFLDQSNLHWNQWETVEPFLKRAAVHFGHTFDYVARVVVWRHLTRGDVDHEAWLAILGAILDRHGRLGNDSEVCWGIYVSIRLRIPIPLEIARNIIKNCGALSMVALLHCVELNLVDTAILNEARELLRQENANGPYWPVMLEWLALDWDGYDQLSARNDTIQEMADRGITVFDSDQLPKVFRDVEEEQFNTVSEAIERRVSLYEADEGDGEIAI